MEENKEFVVQTCVKVLEGLSKKHEIEQLFIRVDLEDLKSKPVFGLFNDSTFVNRSSLKEIIGMGGGKGMSMILGVYIRNIFKNIFSETMKRLELKDSKQMFVLLYLKIEEQKQCPMIALYNKGECIDSMPISDVIDVSG